MTSSLFKEIEEIKVVLHTVYEKSPKKSQELTDLVADLKEVYDLPGGIDLPVRAQGSRWITHKRNALQRVLDRFGAYICHLITLTEDRSVKSEDKAKIRRHINKWGQTRVLIGCALCVDILKAPSLLSVTLQ